MSTETWVSEKVILEGAIGNSSAAIPSKLVTNLKATVAQNFVRVGKLITYPLSVREDSQSFQ